MLSLLFMWTILLQPVNTGTAYWW